MQEIKFKVGDMVKILSEDRTFGWDGEMKNYIGTYAEVQDINTDMYPSSEYKIGYLIKGWWWSADALMKVENKFNPKPGDKIICNNGKEFICCTLEFLQEKFSHSLYSSKSILGYDEDCNEWQDWHDNGCAYLDKDSDYNIREVIPAETKEVMKEGEEPRYTVEEVFYAIRQHVGYESPLDYKDGIKFLLKNLDEDPQYKEYLRLKDIYE